MENIYEWLVAIRVGLTLAVEWYYKVVFKDKIPRVFCWFIVIITLPINIILLLLGILIYKISMEDLVRSGEEMVDEIRDVEE